MQPPDRPTSTRPPLCAAAPLLWSLIPLTWGILVARSGSPPLVLCTACLCLAAPWVPLADRARRLVICLSALAGMLLFSARTPAADPSWSWRPPRESNVVLKVEETFNARKPGRVSGIGKILHTSLPVDTVRGRRAAFYLENPQTADGKLAPGQTIDCKAVLRYLPALPGLDDYQMYLKSRDIHLSLNQGTVTRLIAPPPPLEQLRRRLFAASQQLLASGCKSAEDPGNVLASMLLGNRSLLTDERIELYRRTGTYHLFAVSGLHVGSVALCLFLLTRFLPLPLLVKLIPVLAGTWSYVWLTGSSPSAVRAGIMISCLSLSRVVFSQPHLFPALVLSAWLVLLHDPSQLFQLGFQLSYGVVLAIILVGLPLAQDLRQRINLHALRHPTRSRFKKRFTNALIGLSDLTCVSISAGLASMPLIIQHFGLFTPGGVLFGILLNPLATISVMAGCLSLLTGPIIGSLAAGTLAVLVWPVIRLIEWLLRVCLSIPGTVDERAWLWPPSGVCLLVTILILAWGLQRMRMQGNRIPGIAYLLPHLLVLLVLTFGSIHT